MGKKLGLISGVLVLGMLFFGAVSLRAATLNVGEGKAYVEIQEAIDAASPGDTILVYPGIYEEDILIYFENLTVKALNPAATLDDPLESPAASIIVGSGEEGIGAVNIAADNVTFDGFIVGGAGCAVEIYDLEGEGVEVYSDCVITRNYIIWNGCGIYAVGAEHIISNNYIIENVCGIDAEDGWGFNISNNYITGNEECECGIFAWTGVGFNISNNTIKHNPVGLELIDCPYTTVTGNNIQENGDGIIVVGEITGTEIHFNNIVGNDGYGMEAVEVGVDNSVDATNNWWGDTDGSGPYQEFGNPDGTGDEVSADVDYSPWIGQDETNTAGATISAKGEEGDTGTLTPGESETPE